MSLPPDTTSEPTAEMAIAAARPRKSRVRDAAGVPGGSTLAIENHLLAALPGRTRYGLLARLRPVVLTFGELLYEPGQQIRKVYFPGTALISLLAVADRHSAIEVGLIGREGMLGVALALGSDTSSASALVQGSGTAMEMAAIPFRREFRSNTILQRALLRYAESLMAQIAQTAACNHFHVADQRLARWLLMSSDRLELDHFRMTHEFLGHMLGVRRVGVTAAAQKLQKAGVIIYQRGDITILDRPGLEAASCACYAVVKGIHSAG